MTGMHVMTHHIRQLSKNRVPVMQTATNMQVKSNYVRMIRPVSQNMLLSA